MLLKYFGFFFFFNFRNESSVLRKRRYHTKGTSEQILKTSILYLALKINLELCSIPV